jgi:hypothetical protein
VRLVQGSARVSIATQVGRDRVVTVSDARGSARLERLGPGALLFVCTGYLSAEFYAPMVEPAAREVRATGRLTMFVDGWELRSVDPAFREAWTEWFKSHREHFRMRLLVQSKLMVMAANLANLFSGSTVIKTYANIGLWERDCARDFPGFRGRDKATG